MDSKHVVARFEAERQMPALLDHPNLHAIESLDNLITLTKPGTNQIKPKSGEQNWNKLKILKSDRKHSTEPNSEA